LFEWIVRLVWLATPCAEDISDAMLLSPLPIFLECDDVLLLNMLVTLPRSLSSELLWTVPLLLPLILAICGGIFDRSPGRIGSGSSESETERMVGRSESSLDLGRGRSDVFIGFPRRGVMVLVDC